MISEKKREISRKFSRAAGTYDSFSHVQKKSAADLAEALPAQFSPATILEIGCGTGNYTRLLRSKYPDADIMAIDFSEAMVNHARDKFNREKVIDFLCVDGEEYLATTQNSYDLITSNATLQWFEDLDKALYNSARMLTGEGKLHISLFGPRTLGELGQAFRTVFEKNIDLPASSFLCLADIETAAQKYFGKVECKEQRIIRQYNSLPDLLRHIQKTGAGGFQQAMPYLTKGRMKKIAAWFLSREGYEVTYQVLYVSAGNKPQK